MVIINEKKRSDILNFKEYLALPIVIYIYQYRKGAR